MIPYPYHDSLSCFLAGGECNFQNDWVDEGDGIGLRLESDSSETNQKDPKDSKLLMVPVVPDYSDVRLPGLSSILGPERKQTVYRKDSEDHRRKKLVTFNKKKIVYEDNSHEWTTQKFYNNAFENSPLSSVKELHETENGPFLKKLEARNSNASLSDSFSVADSTENRTESSLLEYDGIQETFSDESSVQIHGNPNHRPNGNVCNGKRSPLSGGDDLSYRTASTLNNGKTVVKYTKSVNRGRNGISHQNGSCNSKTVNSSSSSLERIDIERAHNVGMGSSHGKKNGGMRRISLFEDQNSLAMNHNRARSHSMKNSVHFGVPYIHNINNDDFDSETNRNSMTRRDNSRQTCVRRVPPRTYSMNTTETEGSVSDDDKSCHAPSRPRELYSGQEARSIYRGQESRPTSRSSYDSDCESVNDSVNESHKSHGSAYPRIIIEGDSDTEENCATIGSLSNGLREKRPQRTRGERQMPETLLRTNYIMNELGVENDTIMCSPHIDANVTERLPSTSEDDNVFLDNPTNRQDDFIAPNDVILYCLPDEPQTPNQGNRNFNLSVDQWLSSERERADSGFPMSPMSPHHSDLVIKKMSRKAFNLGESPALR